MEKNLSTPAYLEADYTLIPVSFLTKELGADMEIVKGALVITK